MANLKEFLELGRLGPIAVGLTPDEVQCLLGKPEDIGGTPKSRIWKYESLQLSFHRDNATRTDSVCLIGLYLRNGVFSLPEALQPEGWFPSPGTELSEFVHYLTSHAIAYDQDSHLTFETQIALKTESGASAIFVHTPDGAVLDSIQIHHAPQAAKKRLSRR